MGRRIEEELLLSAAKPLPVRVQWVNARLVGGGVDADTYNELAEELAELRLVGVRRRSPVELVLGTELPPRRGRPRKQLP